MKKFRNEDINSKLYFKEVRRIIMNDMDAKPLRWSHWLSFQRKMEEKGGVAYRKADPFYDAWMCARGECRLVFDRKKLLVNYPSLRQKINEIRDTCNVRIADDESADTDNR